MNQPDAFEQKLKRIQQVALVVGLMASAIAIAGLILGGLEAFFQAYLFSYLYWLGITLGCLVFAMLQLLVGGRWGTPVRRLLEAGSKTLWLMAGLFIPILLGLRILYPWANPEVLAEHPLPSFRGNYLNPPFVILRGVLFFGIWIYLMRGMSRYTEKAAREADPDLKRRYQRFSAFGIILYILTMTFASVDWIMSLQPDFFSTVFGILVAAGQALSGLALVITIVPWFAQQKPLSELMSPDIYRDLGAFLLTAVTFWAYLAFAQYLIIWSGNLPEEISWYVSRASGSWLYLGFGVVILQFFLPFWVLISLRAKRNYRILATVAGIVLVSRLLDNFWEVMPAFHPDGFTVSWLDVIIPIAIGGLWVAAFIWHLGRLPILLRREIDQQSAVQSQNLEVGAHE
jgi:hypothetical protein